MSCNQGDGAIIGVYGVLDDNWNEKTITYNTRPETGDEIAAQPVANFVFDVDITDYVKAEIAKDNVVSLNLKAITKGLLIQYYSTENTDTSIWPVLIINP